MKAWALENPVLAAIIALAALYTIRVGVRAVLGALPWRRGGR